MFLEKAVQYCKKCEGLLYFDEDKYGSIVSCFNCGTEVHPPIVPLEKEVYTGKRERAARPPQDGKNRYIDTHPYRVKKWHEIAMKVKGGNSMTTVQERPNGQSCLICEQPVLKEELSIPRPQKYGGGRVHVDCVKKSAPGHEQR
jgi:DNA-directed RNA polymerase subunit M/transcription elongation factor TFIIS